MPEEEQEPEVQKSKQKESLANLVRQQLKNVGADASTIAEWQEKAESLPFQEFRNLFGEYIKTQPSVNMLQIAAFLKAAESEMLSDKVGESDNIPQEIREAIVPLIEETVGKSIFKIDLDLSYQQIRNAIKTILINEINTNMSADREELKLPFFISKERSISGQVISMLEKTQRTIDLVTVYRTRAGFEYIYFGESKFNYKRLLPYVVFESQFYAYKFVSDTDDYTLLSQEELQLDDCIIDGMLINIADQIKIGFNARLDTKTKVILVTQQRLLVNAITEERFKEITKDWTSVDIIYKYFFGNYPQPAWFKILLLSWIFSGKLDNMPTHLSILSAPSMGKTKSIAAPLKIIFKQDAVSGGTVKGLIPSFAMGHPEEGYFIRCPRIGIVDEFIHIIQSSNKKGGASDLDGGSSDLLKILEHSEDEYRSAFGVIKAKPRMWALFLSNIKPHEHIQNLVDLHERLNKAFMSRILWYVMDKEHMDFINSNKKVVMLTPSEQLLPSYDVNVLSVVDYLRKRFSAIEPDQIDKFYNNWKHCVPADLLQDVYDSRMVMHFARIFDGYIKLMHIIEKRPDLKPSEADFCVINDIFGRIVRSWSSGLDRSKLPPLMKMPYLLTSHREVLEFVRSNQGISTEELRLHKGAIVFNIIESLVKDGLLIQVKDDIRGMDIFYTFDATIR